MKNWIFSLGVFVLISILVLGCSQEIVDDVEESAGEVTDKEQLHQIVDAVPEPEKKEIEQLVQAAGEQQEGVQKKPQETQPAIHAAVKQDKARALPPDENMNPPPKPLAKQLFRGRVLQQFPEKGGINSGELILLDSSLRHYRYTSLIPVVRGDIVFFSVMEEKAVIESKEADERVRTKQKNESVPLQPEGTLLGRIRTVFSTREGVLLGSVRDARTGEDFSYTSKIPLVVTEMVYYRPGSEPVEIVAEAK